MWLFNSIVINHVKIHPLCQNIVTFLASFSFCQWTECELQVRAIQIIQWKLSSSEPICNFHCILCWMRFKTDKITSTHIYPLAHMIRTESAFGISVFSNPLSFCFKRLIRLSGQVHSKFHPGLTLTKIEILDHIGTGLIRADECSCRSFCRGLMQSGMQVIFRWYSSSGRPEAAFYGYILRSSCTQLTVCWASYSSWQPWLKEK